MGALQISGVFLIAPFLLGITDRFGHYAFPLGCSRKIRVKSCNVIGSAL
jgi:hypothetical protein